MTTINGMHIESENLLEQLEGLKFFADANRDALNKNPVFIEFVAFKIDMVQSFIEELQSWEMLGDHSKCDLAIENARFFLKQIQVLMDRTLNQQYEEGLLRLQEEPGFNKYVFKSNEYDLSKAIIYLPQAV